jgi:hypothetical protein
MPLPPDFCKHTYHCTSSDINFHRKDATNLGIGIHQGEGSVG